MLGKIHIELKRICIELLEIKKELLYIRNVLEYKNHRQEDSNGICLPGKSRNV